MIIRFNTKDAHVPESILETMERRTHQRLDSYFKDEAAEATVIYVRIAEQKNMYRVEMTMPYMGYTLRTENKEREISLPALDKGIDILERQMKKVRTRLSRDLRKQPELAVAPELPADTIASLSPAFTDWIARTKEESFLVRMACTGGSSTSISWLVWMTSTWS